MDKIKVDRFEKKYNLKEGTFHRQIKPRILSYANDNHKTIKLYIVGNNPDIGLDDNSIVHLIPSQNKGKCISLKIKIDEFLN